MSSSPIPATHAETITIIAPEGTVLSNPRTMTVTLRLKNGAMHRLGDQPDAYQKIDFNIYDLRLDLKAAWRDKPEEKKNPADMSLSETRAEPFNTAQDKERGCQHLLGQDP